VPSELSARRALPEHTLRCSLSGKRILLDEAELSAITGNPVARDLLKTCALSGKRAEPEHFGRCEFTGTEALNTELAVSDVSGKRYLSISNYARRSREKLATRASSCSATRLGNR
jgi:hypothetical protein